LISDVLGLQINVSIIGKVFAVPKVTKKYATNDADLMKNSPKQPKICYLVKEISRFCLFYALCQCLCVVQKK
jgi:hypothetical protein